MSKDHETKGPSRRELLGSGASLAATAGLSGAGGATGMAALAPAGAQAQASGDRGKVAPGELDDYYVFTSGGHSGGQCPRWWCGRPRAEPLA